MYPYQHITPVMFVDPWGLFTEGDNLYVGGSNDKNDVKVLQNELKWLGLYSGEIDGSYGPATKKAVENYQMLTYRCCEQKQILQNRQHRLTFILL